MLQIVMTLAAGHLESKDALLRCSLFVCPDADAFLMHGDQTEPCKGCRSSLQRWGMCCPI